MPHPFHPPLDLLTTKKKHVAKWHCCVKAQTEQDTKDEIILSLLNLDLSSTSRLCLDFLLMSNHAPGCLVMVKYYTIHTLHTLSYGSCGATEMLVGMQLCSFELGYIL